MGNMKLTSVQLLDDVYKKFKKHIINDNFTVQKLINRSMELYISDENYRNMILNYNKLNKISGSKV